MAEMLKRGIWHVDADNDVNEGIRIASMILNQRVVRFCRETAKITVPRDANLRMGCKSGSTRGRKPLKVRDHGPDAFRYFAKTEVSHWRLAA